MNLIEFILFPILSFLLVCLDTSFFSFHEICSSTIISSFDVIIVFSLFDKRKQALYCAAFAILFLSALSSLPLYVLIIAYFGLPLIISYLKQKIFFDQVLSSAVLIYLGATLLFRILLLPMSDFSLNGLLLSVVMFIIINTLFGIFLFVIAKKIYLREKTNNNGHIW